jgi:hypothetical protein
MKGRLFRVGPFLLLRSLRLAAASAVAEADKLLVDSITLLQ